MNTLSRCHLQLTYSTFAIISQFTLPLILTNSSARQTLFASTACFLQVVCYLCQAVYGSHQRFLQSVITQGFGRSLLCLYFSIYACIYTGHTSDTLSCCHRQLTYTAPAVLVNHTVSQLIQPDCSSNAARVHTLFSANC